jgi:hypothetical protein
MEESKSPSRTDQVADQMRYEVQFEADGGRHSASDSLEEAKLFARSLANWNHSAQVFDRRNQTIVFKAPAYGDSLASAPGGSVNP